MAKVQNPSFITSKRQFYGPPFGAKNAPAAAPKAKAAAGSSNMPKVPPVQADTLHGNVADEDAINQGALKGQKGLKVRRTSSGYMRKN